MLPAAFAFLHAHGVEATPDEIDAAVAEALRAHRPVLYPKGGSGLTGEERAFLAAGGVDPAVEIQGPDPLVRGVAQHAAVLKTALSTAEMAAALGVTEARVRQRLQKRTLFGVETRHGWRIPSFQLTADGELPGWSAVAPHLPAELSAAELLAWLTLPNADLVVGEDETPVSPLDWLRAGRGPRAVAALAEGLA
jgi:hypothetical protein